MPKPLDINLQHGGAPALDAPDEEADKPTLEQMQAQLEQHHASYRELFEKHQVALLKSKPT